MPETIFGLPTHAIVVHGTVVLLPLAALVVLLTRSGRPPARVSAS